MLQGGYACTKIFYSWNSVTLDFGGHICQIMHFEDTYGALERNIPEKKFIFQSQLRPKVTIKGMKKIEIKGAEIRKKVVISLCLFRYGTFFEYKTIAKKTCAPKTRATLAMPNILFGVCRCRLFVCRV